MRPAEYVWNGSDPPVSIHLPLDVVSRLGLEAMEAYKSVPHRGLEVGGLLLGRRAGETLYIDGFLPVESEHRSGPSYILSESDLQVLENALQQHPEAIGVYRTQTRLDALSLQVDDVDLFGRYFSDPESVYLLIQPSAGKAAYFLPANQTLALAHEFPFRASDLRDEATAVESPAAVAPARLPDPVLPLAGPIALAATPPELMAAETPKASDNARPLPRWMVPVAAIALGMATGAVIYGVAHQGSQTAKPTAAQPVATAPAPPPTAADHVALNVQRDSTSMRLLWDRNSPTVRDASKAILHISDGSHQSQLNLDPKELRSGLISYWPESNDVTFRLEVFGAGHSSDDSIRVVGGVPVPAPLPRRAAAQPPVPAAPHDSPSHPAPVLTQPSTPPSPQGSASRSEIPAESAESRPSPFTPVPKPPAAPVTPLPTPAAPVVSASAREPQVWVKVEPVSESRGIIGHIPLLRRFKKQPQSFVPPTPLREVRPSMSPRERHALVAMVPVDVKVYVANTGKVQFVELLSNSYRHEDLASSAVYAARHWEFSPARMGEDKVPGEVILHFRFSPEEPPLAAK